MKKGPEMNPFTAAQPGRDEPGRCPNTVLVLAAAALVAAGAVGALADDRSALIDALAVERARPPAARFERADFLVRPTIRGPRLSPDGRFVAYFHEQGSRRSLWVLETAGTPYRRLLPDTDATELAWSRDGRWLFLESPRRLFALALEGQGGTGLVTPLRGLDQRRWLGVDPSHPAAVLVSEELSTPGTDPRDPARPVRHRLLRLVPGEAEEVLHEGPRRILGALVDGRGRLAYLTRIEGAEHVIHRVDDAGRLTEVVRCTPLVRSGCTALSIAPDGQGLHLRTYLGSDLTGLVRLEPDDALRPLHSDPAGEADIDEVTLDPLDGRPLLASYRSVTAHTYALDPETARHLAAIEARLPGRDLRFQVGRGPRARWLISERDGGQQGERFHLYDPARSTLTEILETQQAPSLPPAALARKIPFAFRASDGLRLHGFLLVPPGVDLARLPLVADVHGGPWNHVDTGYDTIAQFLVNREYAVFRPNFRGSTGHGRAYLLAGRGDFGNGRVQQDIVDGVRHLLAMGIGDPERVGITGASFGGYSTLLGVTFEPDLFKVGVALVPPPDFGWVLAWNARHTDASAAAGIPLAESLAALSLGLDEATLARLHAQSPLARAAQLRRPLLLFAGGQDERVALRSVTHYAATLQALGKDVTLFIDPEEGHSPRAPLTREAFLYLLEDLLHRHLGGAEATAPSRELGEHLDTHIRRPKGDRLLPVNH